MVCWLYWGWNFLAARFDLAVCSDLTGGLGWTGCFRVEQETILNAAIKINNMLIIFFIQTNAVLIFSS
jgi:hypothetical protein